MHHAAKAANMTAYPSAMVQGTYAQRRRGDAQNPVAQKQQILLVLINRHRLQVEVARWLLCYVQAALRSASFVAEGTRFEML